MLEHSVPQPAQFAGPLSPPPGKPLSGSGPVKALFKQGATFYP